MPFPRVLMPSFYAIGIKPNGDKAVLEMFRSKKEAEDKAKSYRQQLEDYASITIEQVTGEA